MVRLRWLKLELMAVGLSFALAACTPGPRFPSRPIPSPPPPAPHLIPPTQRPYEVYGKVYNPIANADGFRQEGIASWYGAKFHGRRTADGEIYNMNAMTAAHKTLPMNIFARVTNLDNGKSVVVRINDRGPFVDGRVIDLSSAAARAIGMHRPGTAPVRVQALGYARVHGNGTTTYEPAGALDRGNFTIQVGAFSSLKSAMKLKNRLAASFENAHITVYDGEAKVLYRVRVGAYTTLEDGARAQQRLAQMGFRHTFLVAE